MEKREQMKEKKRPGAVLGIWHRKIRKFAEEERV